MSGLLCRYCLRSNFKSQRGLDQHQQTSRTCNPEARALRDALSHHQPNVPANNGQNEENQDTSMEMEDSLTGNNPDLSSMNLNDTMDMSGGFPEDDSSLPAGDDNTTSMGNIIDLQDDDSWGIGDYFPLNTGADEDNGPAGEALQQFKDYVANCRDHCRPLSYYERSSIKLMHLLRRKGASLDTYDDVMKWHLEANGDENPDAFISRHNLIKMLGKRYNIPRTYLKERSLVLPSSGAKVNLIYHDARDIVVSLLTDPRFSDDDFLHFNNDPLAPPPEEFDYIADLNTGLAYRETYKKLITKPGKQMLVPIVLYQDGAVTGQFDKLQVEAMKVGLGIMTKEARDRGEAWRPVGTLDIIPRSLAIFARISAHNYCQTAHRFHAKLHTSRLTWQKNIRRVQTFRRILPPHRQK